jgi:hypothetical protein
MRGKLVIPIIGVIILSFFGSSFAEQKVQTKSIQVTAGVLPDLVVESIWLDNQCNINFKLRNSGKGNIPDGEHRESVVRVQIGSEIKDFPLGRIDPNGVLKKSGGLVSFNAQILLKTSVDVKVIADFNKKIRETDAGEKHNEKVVKLTPQCPSVAKVDLKTKILTDEGAKSQTSDMPLQKSKTLTIPPPGKVGTQADTAPLNITIISPTKNSSWNTGSSLNIQWKGIPSQGNFHIHLKTPWMGDTLPSGIGEPVAATIVSYTKMQPNQQGVFSYDWKIPSSITPQDYIVKIIYADDPKVFSKSEVFKINKGGPSIITPKTLYSGSPVKGFGVEVPLSSNQWRAGEAARIFWQILNTIFSDQNSLDQMDEKVSIVLKDMGGAERLTIAQNVVNRKWVDWQNLKWTIPEGFPDGKYIVRVETTDGHFYGESLPFTIWNPKVAKMDKTEKIAGTEKVDLSKVIKTPPPPVTGTFKLLSMIPVMDSQTKRLARIDLTVEIDASSDFQLVGDPIPQDPMLKPVSVQPYLILILKHRCVSVYPTNYKTSNQNYQILGNYSWIGREFEILEWQPGYCGMQPLVCPTGVLKKGKNVVTFKIYVQLIPQSYGHYDPSWWAPLTTKRNLEFLEFDRDTGKNTRLVIVLTEDWDLFIKVILQFYGGGGFGSSSVLESIVSQPRGFKYLPDGYVH